MGQQEVLKVLNDNPGKKFNVFDLARMTKVGPASVGKSLKTLREDNNVNHESINVHNKIKYNYWSLN